MTRLTHVIATVALLGAGCVELAEDVAIEPNGHGTLSLTLSMDALLAGAAQLGGEDPCPPMVTEAEGVRILHREHGESDGTYLCHETVAFDSVEHLNDPEDPTNHFQLEVVRGLFRDVYHFRQQIAADPNGAPDALLGDLRWRLHLRLPGTVVDGNADHVAGSDANWSRPIATVVRDGLVIEATSERTSLARAGAAAGLVASLALLLIAWGARAARPPTPPESPPLEESIP